MAAVRPRGDGAPGAELELDGPERRALDGLLVELEPLLARSGRAAPAAYPDQPELEAEYRRLVGPDLEAARRAALGTIRRGLQERGPVSRLEPEEVEAWLRALNVLRLALGDELGIAEDGWEEALDPAAHARPPYAALHALAWIQEALIAASGRPRG